MSFNDTLRRLGIEQAVNYLYKDPEKNLSVLMDWADRFAGGEFVTQRKVIREAIENPNHPYYAYIRHIVSEIDPKVMKTLVTNFFINAAMIGWPMQEEMRKKYDCNIPWAILKSEAKRS